MAGKAVCGLCDTGCSHLDPVGVQIIHVNLTSADLKPIEATGNVEFTYSVHWSPTDIHFSQRFERYLDQNFFEHQVSFMSSGAIL